MKKNTSILCSESTKSMLVILGVIFFSVFLIGTISAFEFDNWKDYNEEKKEYTITNAFGLPLIGQEIAKVKLTSDLNVLVPRGYQKVAEFEVKSYEDYVNVFNDMEFYDLNKNNEFFTRDFDYKYKTIGQVPNYKTVCDKGLDENGTIVNTNCRQEQKGLKDAIVWKEINKLEGLLKGNVTIGIFTDVKVGDKVEWIPTLFGERLIEWARWEEGWNTNLIAYYKLDRATGTVVDEIGDHDGINSGAERDQSGQINKSFFFVSGDSGHVNISNEAIFGKFPSTLSISMWGNWSATGTKRGVALLEDNSAILGVSGGGIGIEFSDTFQFAGTPAFNLGQWYHLVGTWNGTFVKFYLDGQFNDSIASSVGDKNSRDCIGCFFAGSTPIQFMDGQIDEIAIWNRTLTDAEISDIYDAQKDGFINGSYTADFDPPTITLNSPIEAFNSTSDTIIFNGTTTSSFGTLNVNLTINGVLNETNSSIINGVPTLFTKKLSDGSYNWTYSACNVNGCSISTIRNFTVDTTPIINVFSPTNSTFSDPVIFFNATNSIPVDAWIVNYNGTNVTLSDINTTLEIEDGSHQLLLYANNSVSGVFGLNDTIFFTVDTLFPQVIATSPIGDQGTFTSGINLTLSWNVTDDFLDACFYDYEGSNTTVTCSANITNLTVTDSANTTLIFWANDTSGKENSSTTSWSYSFIENLITFNKNVSETSLQFFEINLTTSLSVLSITAQLDYDETNYTSTASCDGFCIVNNTIDLPLVPSGETDQKNFFWSINIFNGTDSINVMTSTQTQNVSKVHLETCDGTYTIQSLNFTAYDEQNLTRLSLYRFDGTFDIWTGGGDVKRNNNFTEASLLEKTLCIFPNATYFTDAQIEYNTPGNSTIYTTRNYYFQNDTINNVSQEIPLYLLKSGSSTSFILKVQDDNLLPLEDHIIIIQRFYPGENLFRTVQIAKTSETGKTIGFFETETVDYRFIIKKDGRTLLTTTRQKIVGETAPFTITFTIGEELGKPWQTLENLTALDFSLNFNKSTNIITYTYVDTSGNFTLGTLIVEKVNFSFSTNAVLCNLNSSQSSATITCNITGNGTGTYAAKGFITRGNIETLINQINFIIEDFQDTVGLLGVLLAWFLILISSFAFKFNEIAGIFMINATVIFVNIIGLVSFGMLAISALIAVSIIIVVVLEK